MANRVKYPVGQQSFEELRANGYAYVDKTKYIERLVDGSQYYFLGRPRRFGKSLFLSTLKCFFEGKRELFNGLYADSMEWEWRRYPVLYIDLNIHRYKSADSLDKVLLDLMLSWEREYGVTPTVDDFSIRFKNVISAADERYGGIGVVILVDEYDKPLVNNLDDSERFRNFRDELSSFYANFKSGADHIRMVFMTGVSRFGKLSVFSGLNNIRDLTFNRDFAGICGMTECEIDGAFKYGIETLAEDYGCTVSDIRERLRRTYDGYRFTPKEEYVYNPYSLLSVLADRNFQNYWIESGTPSLLYEQFRKQGTDIARVMDTWATQTALSGLDFDNINPVSLLYQTGYLTIKEWNQGLNAYRLGMPNDEVKKGFMEYLLPMYADMQGEEAPFFVHRFVTELKNGDVDTFMKRLQSMFAHTPYDLKMEDENNVQSALYMLITLAGLDVRAEERTSDGRIDLFIRTERYYYIMELKFDGSPEEAMRQINEKGYELPFAFDGHEVIKIGANFSGKIRNIDGWVVER